MTTRQDLANGSDWEAWQVDTRSMAGNGETTRTISDYAGNGTTLLARTVTWLSADRRTQEISVDVDGDGDTDRTIDSVKAQNGSQTTTERIIWHDGAVEHLLRQTVTTVTANGLTTSVAEDVNGDGQTDVTTVSATTIGVNGDRTTDVELRNGDASLQAATRTIVSDDGLVTTVWTDRDGDADGDGNADYDLRQVSTTTIATNGSRTTLEEEFSGDGAPLSRRSLELSDDGLVTTLRSDADGDGDFDLIETTTVELLTDGGRRTTVELKEADNGPRRETVTTVSDDGRSVQIEEDVNADGQNDRITSRVLGSDGILTETVSELSATNLLQSRLLTTTSDDGLLVTRKTDLDGDGIYDHITETATQHLADGSRQTTVTEKAGNGGALTTTVTVLSADGWTTTTTRDIDQATEAGTDVDFTETVTRSTGLTGVETQTTVLKDQNGTALRVETVTVSANGRTVTTDLDHFGSAAVDRTTTVTRHEDGGVVTQVDDKTANGAVVSRQVTEVSGDGLHREVASDRNGDGVFELAMTAETTLHIDGSSETARLWQSDRHVVRAQTLDWQSDDGLRLTRSLDLDGDGVFEARGETETRFEADGDVVTTRASFDGTAAAVGGSLERVSGNGLTRHLEADYTGDGSLDRIVDIANAADGAQSMVTRLYGAGAVLKEQVTASVTADGRTATTHFDLDGDGTLDRSIVAATNLSRDVTTTWEDYEDDADLAVRLVQTQLANGSETVLAIDRDGNGEAELRRSLVTETEADGDRVVTRTESYAPVNGNLGLGRIAWQQVTVTSGDGLTSTTTYDVNGDGTIDGTTLRTTAIAADGVRTETRSTTYADGSLRESSVATTGRDGRSFSETADFDGNGIADRSIIRTVGVDGSVTETQTGFNAAGVRGNVFVTTTSADGLETRILRADGIQVISRSPTGNGSYIWDNGVTASTTATHVTVTHRFDAFGVETWTSVQTWLNGAGQVQTSTAAVRLDAAAKAEILADAARLYDTVLDRDMDVADIEQLAHWIGDGQLNATGLAGALVSAAGFGSAQGEFNARYGTMKAADFVTQLYLNSFGRGPTLAELDRHLRAINETTSAVDTAARVALAVELADRAEHHVTGNGHMSTNNFDVILNPAVFERSLDRAYAEEIARALVDVVYDRDATAREVGWLSGQLLTGTLTTYDLAEKLLADKGDLFGAGVASLKGLTGAALVEQAFVNALGRQPSAAEQALWEQNLANQLVSAKALVVALALSADHQADGNAHQPHATPTASQWYGGAGAQTYAGTAAQDDIFGGAGDDVLSGAAASDQLTGGAGNDTLNGGDGSDRYVWTQNATTPDGNDVINDTGTSLTEEDRLVLTNVTAPAAGVKWLFRSGTDILLKIGSETVTLQGMLGGSATGTGLEAIQFSNGAVWTRADILAAVVTESPNDGAGANSHTGTAGRDNLFGGAGDDSLAGGDGDDVLTGGTGLDTAEGGNGADRYVWMFGDGQDTASVDTVNDAGTSLTEIDVLDLFQVTMAEVLLSQAHNGVDLFVDVTRAGTTQRITVKNQLQNAATGAGIELIRLADGTWTLEDIIARTTLTGTSGADPLTGTAKRDWIKGLGGADTLTGGAGADTLTGASGNDSLVGGDGGDSYRWESGAGNDTINDGGSSAREIDGLNLAGINSTAVTLSRSSGSTDLKIVIGGETITVTNQFYGLPAGRGLEQISFGDGVVWTLDEILARTGVTGNDSPNTLVGLDCVDRLYGGGDSDSLTGGNGDDLLVGGAATDTLDGGTGNDRVEWSTGDGSDLVRDTGTSLAEIDTLALVNAGADDAVFDKSGQNITITIGTEVITLENRLNETLLAASSEIVEFADGSILRVLTHEKAILQYIGTADDDTPATPWAFRDLIYGAGGNDSLDAKGGDDTLYGGTGNDTLKGGNGSDAYHWALGDGNDTLNDNGTSQTETDTLVLDNVEAAAVRLTHASGSNDLLVEIDTGGDSLPDITLRVSNRFASTSSGAGIDAIRFADDTLWTLDDILALTATRGGANPDTLTGTAWRDNLFGEAANDSLSASGGNDQLTGGLGNDTLNGGSGNDSYVWARGDGADTLIDSTTTLTETDTLLLTDVEAADVTLRRSSLTSAHLTVTIAGTGGASLRVNDQFGTALDGKGIERIVFADGASWDIADILARAEVTGDDSPNSLTGWVERDNLYGAGGDDTLDGGAGDDWLYGGGGSDTLYGGAGSDHYVWTHPSGNDRINDTSTSLDETDTLVLRNVDSSLVTLHRPNNQTYMLVRFTIGGTDYEIRVDNQVYDPAQGRGLERILFENAAGVPGGDWNLQDILSRLVTYGSSGADTLTGTAFGDNMTGIEGNDSLLGNDGDDSLAGGAGADTISGGNGVDLVSYYDATGAAPGVIVDLAVTGAQGGGAGAWSVGDVLSGIENLRGSLNADDLRGDDNSNRIEGLGGNDTIKGRDGFDEIDAGAGNDTVYGGLGADWIKGGDDNDVIYGDEGTDTLGGGDDSLEGGNGNDILRGEKGSDILSGDTGNDTLTGDETGSGAADYADVFVIRGTQFGQDVVTDFDALDRIDLSQVGAIVDFADLIAHHISEVGGSAIITDGTNTLQLTGITVASLTAAQFLF